MTKRNIEFEGTARLFTNGRSQAVRLPAGCRFEGDQVYVRKVGDQVILSPRPFRWDDFFDDPERPSEDFMAERHDLPLPNRDGL